MKLSEKLKEIPPDTLIAIGAAAGFFYIGRADDWPDARKRINRTALEDKLRTWLRKCEDEERAARLNHREYIEPPRPEHIPFEKRKVIDCYKTTIDRKLAIIVEGKEYYRFGTVNDWLDKSEEQRAREYIQSLYALKDGYVIRKAPYDDTGYERIREMIIKTRAQGYVWAHKQYAEKPNEENAIKLQIARSRLRDDTFKTLCSGLDVESLIKMIEARTSSGSKGMTTGPRGESYREYI